MIYTNLTKKALQISFEAHKNQVDKSGIPYIYHPYEVASHMDDEFSICAALLHDVVEDTDTSLEDLSEAGFPTEVTEALMLLTHDDRVPYLEYISKIKNNDIARKVKVADLNHNMNLNRLEIIPYEYKSKLSIYKQALEILSPSCPAKS